MNLLSTIAGREKTKRIFVYTQYPADSKKKLFELKQENISIIRSGRMSPSRSRLGRLFQYVKFYWTSTKSILTQNPASILYIETLSFLPVWIYLKLSFLFKRKATIYCHYHEYTTPDEYQNGMALSRFLHKKERKHYDKMKWISHNNQYRLSMFKTDVGQVDESILKILPNYPPANWQENINNKIPGEFPLKIVYIGSLNLKVMFVEEFATWIKSQGGKLLWDVYSYQQSDEIKNFFKALDAPYIQFKGPVDYELIPQLLKNYDIGVILYKGVIPNEVYSETNKLFEYLSCGLSVWYPQTIKGIAPFRTSSDFPKVIEVDFNRLSTSDLLSLTLKNAPFKKTSYLAEEAFRPLVEEILV